MKQGCTSMYFQDPYAAEILEPGFWIADSVQLKFTAWRDGIPKDHDLTFGEVRKLFADWWLAC